MKHIIRKRLEYGGGTQIEIGKKTPRFDAVIVGGGPGGSGAAIALLDAAKIQGKQLRIGIIDPKGFGGEIGSYQIAGNSTACEVIDGIDTTSVADSLNHASARRIAYRCEDPQAPAQLPEVGDYYQQGLAEAITAQIGEESVIRETVSKVVFRNGQYVILGSVGEEIAQSASIVLATGAHEEPIPEMQNYAGKLIFSGEVFRKTKEGDMRQALESVPLEQRQIVILGNSHGAWAGVNRLLEDFGDLLPAGGIKVVGRHDTKVTFGSLDEAQSVGYEAAPEDISPVTGEVNPFGGIKHDAKDTYLKVISGRQPKVSLVRYETFDEVKDLFDSATLVVQAVGLSTNVVKIFNDQGEEIGPEVVNGKVKMNTTAQLYDNHGNILPQAYGIGVGYEGFLRTDDQNREPGFTGAFFGTTSYRTMVAPSIAEQIIIPAATREFYAKLKILGMNLPESETKVEGRAELLTQTSSEVFDPQKDTALVVIAHPDDEEFVGATIRKLRKRGKQVVVIALTDGSAGGEEPQETTRTRKAEMLRAMNDLDVNIYVNLGFADGILANHQAQAEERLVQYMRVFDADVVIGHRRKDYHTDHVKASEITDNALFQARNANHILQGIPQSRKNPAYYEMDPQGLRTRKGKLAKVDMVIKVRRSDLQERTHAFEDHASQVYGIAPDGDKNYVEKSIIEARFRGRTGGYTWGEGLTQPNWGGERFTSQNILGGWLGRREYRQMPKGALRRKLLEVKGAIAGIRQII